MNKPKKFARHGVADLNGSIWACFALDFVVGFTESRPKMWKDIQCPVDPALKLLELPKSFASPSDREGSTGINKFGSLGFRHCNRHRVGINFKTNNRDT